MRTAGETQGVVCIVTRGFWCTNTLQLCSGTPISGGAVVFSGKVFPPAGAGQTQVTGHHINRHAGVLMHFRTVGHHVTYPHRLAGQKQCSR